ncbi:MAG: type I restriction-modification system subunit M [Muribaculum sp.]|nr:type I restriction-modification system subunit M [Muribaculum sp.]
MNKQQLASKIWASANKMRSKIEANEYKDYILGFIFYKFLSDKEVAFLKANDWDAASMKEYLYEDKVPETVEQCKRNLGYFIAYNDLFSTWIAPETEFGVADVRDALSRFARLISPAHQKVYKGIFDTLQNGLSKLGESTGAQTKAINNLLALIKDIPTDGSEDYDVLGFIYEFLISNFAANAGKKAGEFYTPHEVALMMSEIVAHHLRGKSEITIYDPTSGSGSLLLNIGRSVSKYLSRDKITYFAQELKEATYNLTRMNLVMRGIHPDNIYVRNGDTLEEDWPFFDESDPLATYKPLYCDAVVSNPPYSQEWSPREETKSDPRYNKYGVAPKGTADYAFLLHDLYHVKPDGIMTIVLPHGVLFRGGSEEDIRRNLIEKNNIDAIIGLPANIFFGTGIPTIVMVLRQKRDRDDVLFVDASKGFGKFGKNNQLRARDIRKIVDAVTERREIPKFSRRVSRETIKQNDYNLNIPRYVNSAEADEQWDIYATMFGGIPNTELDTLAPFWTAFPSLRSQLFEETTEGYSRLIPKPEDVKNVIVANADVRSFAVDYSSAVAPIATALNENLIEVLGDAEKVQAINPNKELHKATESLFNALAPFALIDSYEAYQSLIDRWAMIGGDLEVIQSEGVKAANAVDPNMVVKKKDGKDVEVQDGWVGRIIPIDLVEKVLLTDELEELQKLREAAEATTAQITEIIENLPESEGQTTWLKDDNSAFVPKELKAKVKKIKQEYGSKVPNDSMEAQLVEADKLLDIEKKQYAEVKHALCELLDKAIETIKGLTLPQIQQLLEAKWIEPLTDDLHNVAQNLVDRFADSLTALAAKYGETLVDIDTNINNAEQSLASLIDNLTGSDKDIAGLREFQKLLRHE